MPSTTVPATLDQVIDGDSLVITTRNGNAEIRLYGIDAPDHPQPGADEARTALARMLGRQTFWVEYQHTDPYDRPVCMLYDQDRDRRNSINLRLVREGYAFAYTPHGGKDMGFHQAEADARQGRRGVWQESPASQEQPWEYRQQQRDDEPTGGIIALPVAIILIVILATIVIMSVAPSFS